MSTRYIINLTEEERFGLQDLASREGVSKLKSQRARILLKADEDLPVGEIAEDLGVGTATVERIRKPAVPRPRILGAIFPRSLRIPYANHGNGLPSGRVLDPCDRARVR